jgi:hypothetical protein
MPTGQLSGEKKFPAGLTYSIRSIRQGRMGGDRAGRQGWPPGKGGSKGVGPGEEGRPGAGPLEVIITSLYVHILICLYFYIFI